MSVLKKPIITEKMTALTDKLKQYGFIVDKLATKTQIKSEIEKMYNVNVATISTLIHAGKNKTRFTRKGLSVGRKPAYKKAIVTLKEGQVIDFFENV
ncbi:MAG: 50S ribosomal protein L23 [Bacteroidia bacterium]|nr:50S ribosomal protein L23 [Bacteroidia bacterium]